MLGGGGEGLCDEQRVITLHPAAPSWDAWRGLTQEGRQVRRSPGWEGGGKGGVAGTNTTDIL